MPNADFLEKLKDASARLAEVFKMNVLWNVRQDSRTTWIPEDAIEFLKIIWIASLIEYAQDEEFAELVGTLQYDTHYFDLHWNIALVDDEENVGDVIQRLPKALLKSMGNAGSHMSDWAKTLHSSNAEHYINFWLLVFGDLLGWTLPDVERWAAVGVTLAKRILCSITSRLPTMRPQYFRDGSGKHREKTTRESGWIWPVEFR